MLDRPACRLVVALALAGVSLVLVDRAWAAAARKPAGRARGLSGELTAQLGTELASPDDQVAAAAAKRLGELGGAEAAEAVMGALAVGVRPPVAVEALAALGKIGDGRALPLVVTWSGNVNEPVRLAAVKALGHFPERRAADILIDRLGDAAGPVRAAAAEALAGRKEARAEKRLFLLVQRNDPGAAGPLGAVMSPDSVPRLAELHGRVDESLLATALGEFLKRPDVPDRLRVDVVRTLARLPDAAATAALVEYLASVPERDSRPSKEEAQKAIDQRGAK